MIFYLSDKYIHISVYMVANSKTRLDCLEIGISQ